MNINKLKEAIKNETYDNYMESNGYSEEWEIIEDLIKALEKHAKGIIKLNNTLEHLRKLHSEKGLYLKLNCENVTNIILEQKCYDSMKGHAPAIMTADKICKLQEGKNG